MTATVSSSTPTTTTSTTPAEGEFDFANYTTTNWVIFIVSVLLSLCVLSCLCFCCKVYRETKQDVRDREAYEQSLLPPDRNNWVKTEVTEVKSKFGVTRFQKYKCSVT